MGYWRPFCSVSPARLAASPARGGVHSRISDRWCWGLRHAALAEALPRQWEGTVDADELDHTAAQKGHATQGGQTALGRRARGRRKQREPGRGHADKDRPAMMAGGSRHRSVVIQATRACTMKPVQKAADLAVQTGRRRYTDSASRDRALQGDGPDDVKHTKTEEARGEGQEHRAECLCSWLTPSWRVCRGVSQCNRPGDIGFLQFLRNVRPLKAFAQADLSSQAAFDPAMASWANTGELVTCFDHVELRQTAIN